MCMRKRLQLQQTLTSFSTGEPTMPVPRGAGTRRTRTEPHLPCTFMGIVWGELNLLTQYPLRTGINASFAAMMPPRIAVATSFDIFEPRPMCPFISPTSTKHTKRLVCPADVIFLHRMDLHHFIFERARLEETVN